ncbi:tyrosine-type recombinase/integrase [Fictibacillus terranigra]|uniref:Tyrosine-type recombinase/integrase n=1 Tax=Fictibacillus terranigra TaxID=3058424 RepID=A0ABT8E578_9BACL|nr:tyrosine-type recombinase/integrase [Fictibacillus sp. CENA-BCM004]MDN4073067.1 tyrosine-type recombinase/integrase [Fictibacillus sp. CENA-BCM004]
MDLKQATDDFLMYLQVEKNYSKNTLKSYAFDLKLYASFLTKHDRSLNLDDLTAATTRRFIQEQVLEYQIKPRTLQRRISALKSFCVYCIKENYLKHNFMLGVQAPKSDKKLPVYMTLQELLKLFTYLENSTDRFATRNHVMFKLLATTGMRRQELVDLTWEQIDMYNQTIRIFGKGKKERLLPLHPILIPLLKEYIEQQEHYQLYPTEPVFLNKNKMKMDPRGLHKVFKDILPKAGLPPKRYSLHHLRHTFATLLLQNKNNKVDIRILQELLGHESLSTTAMYTHVNLEQKKACNSFIYAVMKKRLGIFPKRLI